MTMTYIIQRQRCKYYVLDLIIDIEAVFRIKTPKAPCRLTAYHPCLTNSFDY
jgi:hypothetical protein